MSLTFAALKLHDALLAALNEAGYTEPTPVQAQAIPIALEGKDLMASAQTGTGKTAAFILPALHRITKTPGGPGKGPRILVLTPTRELARQVESAARVYGARLRIRTASILGGMNYQQQARQLQRPVDVMVATPGRLLDLMNRGTITLDRVEVLVLDEADRMLDLGFIDDVELIAEQAPAERQTLLFSATLENRIATLAARVMNNPERLQISSQTAKHENIEQSLYFCDDMAHKKAILLKLLADPSVNQSVVFTATRRDSEELSIELANFGIQAAALHGDMKQPARNRTLRALKDGGVRCLVATDVAARGIDVILIVALAMTVLLIATIVQLVAVKVSRLALTTVHVAIVRPITTTVLPTATIVQLVAMTVLASAMIAQPMAKAVLLIAMTVLLVAVKVLRLALTTVHVAIVRPTTMTVLLTATIVQLAAAKVLRHVLTVQPIAMIVRALTVVVTATVLLLQQVALRAAKVVMPSQSATAPV